MIAEVVASLGGGRTYTVTRRAAPSGPDAAGAFTAGSTSTFDVTGLDGPAPGEVLQRLPPGRSSTDVRWFGTATALRTAKDAAESGYGADTVSIGGIAYEVQEVDSLLPAWANGYAYVVAKVG